MGIILMPAAALAAPGAASRAEQSGSDPATSVTFAVTTGELTISVPDSADLGSGAPGTDIVGDLGTVLVTDDRAALNAVWTATASDTNFVTGGGTMPETILATDVDYATGDVATTGTVTAATTDITMNTTPQDVVDASGVVGDNTASWDPQITVHVPDAAVTGTYTGTITHSVS
ncbi:MAG TPA: hypothetical protein VMA95_13585 [Streptosporangiaceae bacterium]|nr:hypothetical protein [Streptosporangiaceae bacterium]